jgi:hypothetical protein
MKPLLKQYLVWGIVVLFVVAAAVDYGGWAFGDSIQDMGMDIPQPAMIILSIRHWVFVLPVAMLVLTIVLYPRVRSEGILLHLFGGMMLVTLAMIMILSVAIVLSMFAMHGFGGGGE